MESEIDWSLIDPSATSVLESEKDSDAYLLLFYLYVKIG